MKNTWHVTIEVDGRKIISISEGHISGIGDVSDYEDEIREGAKHLLSFIGELGKFEIYEKYYHNSFPYFLVTLPIVFSLGVAVGWLFL